MQNTNHCQMSNVCARYKPRWLVVVTLKYVFARCASEHVYYRWKGEV